MKPFCHLSVKVRRFVVLPIKLDNKSILLLVFMLLSTIRIHSSMKKWYRRNQSLINFIL